MNLAATPQRFVVILVAAACGYFGLVRVRAANAASPTPNSAQETQQETSPESRGVEMGDFLIKEYHPIRGAKSTLRFSLYAVMEADMADEFAELISQRRHKVRDQVITAARHVDVADFDDPHLVKLRRRIVLRLHRAMPELELKEVLVTDFNFALEL